MQQTCLILHSEAKLLIYKNKKNNKNCNMEVKRMVCASYSMYRNHKLHWIFYEGLGPVIKFMILFSFCKIKSDDVW